MIPPAPRAENPRAARITHPSARIPRHHDPSQHDTQPELRSYLKLTKDKPRMTGQMDMIGCNHIPQTMAIPVRPQTHLRQLRIAGLDTLFKGTLVAGIPFNPMHPLTIDAKHRFNGGCYASSKEQKRMGVTVSTYM